MPKDSSSAYESPTNNLKHTERIYASAFMVALPLIDKRSGVDFWLHCLVSSPNVIAEMDGPCDGKGKAVCMQDLTVCASREGEPPWTQRWNSVGALKRRLEIASHAQNPLRCRRRQLTRCCGVKKGLDSSRLPLGSVVWARMVVQHPRTYLLQASSPHMGAASLK